MLLARSPFPRSHLLWQKLSIPAVFLAPLKGVAFELLCIFFHMTKSFPYIVTEKEFRLREGEC